VKILNSAGLMSLLHSKKVYSFWRLPSLMHKTPPPQKAKFPLERTDQTYFCREFLSTRMCAARNENPRACVYIYIRNNPQKFNKGKVWIQFSTYIVILYPSLRNGRRLNDITELELRPFMCAFALCVADEIPISRYILWFA
jgi:hypothetical protein